MSAMFRRTICLCSSRRVTRRPSRCRIPYSFPLDRPQPCLTATVVDDALIDGPQVAVVTAHVPGWIDATASVVVQDNENLNLAVTVPTKRMGELGGVTKCRLGLDLGYPADEPDGVP